MYLFEAQSILLAQVRRVGKGDGYDSPYLLLCTNLEIYKFCALMNKDIIFNQWFCLDGGPARKGN